jgi:hypothetical protein
MKSLFAAMAMMTLAALTGCTQGTPGGPGTTDDKPVLGQDSDTFNLTVPYTSTSLQQGAQTETTVGIKRAKNFDHDVVLGFVDVPKGVTIEPANPVIKHGDTDAKITLMVEDEAALGDFNVKVTGHPTKGDDAQSELKLTIVAKDSFALSVPRLSTSLNQGEATTVSIGIKRDKSFDQDIAITFGEMPKGVTIEPVAPVINRGDTGVQVVFTASDDASLGDFEIPVTGHPTKGADTSDQFKLTIAQK